MFSLVIQRTEALPVNADPTMLAWISAIIYSTEKERYNWSEKLKTITLTLRGTVFLEYR